MLELREKLYKDHKQGFTLAELLVVVAIIAILVAVSIPIFTGKLEETRRNTDLANERAAKAAAIADYLQSDEKEYWRYYDAESGTLVEADPAKVEGYNQSNLPGEKGRNKYVISIQINRKNEAAKPELILQWDEVKNF